MATTVSAFVLDRSFVNPTTAFIPVLDEGGIGRLTQNALSYFVDATFLQDARDPTTRSVDWVASYAPVLAVDSDFYSDFISNVNTLSADQRNSIFALIDALLFKTFASQSALETFLTSTDGIKDFYVADSLIEPTLTVSDLVYPSSTPAGVNFTSHPTMTATISIPVGTTTEEYAITFYIQCEYWVSHYPNTKIVGVSPPLSYTDLLTLPLTTTNANKLATATTTVGLNYDTLAAEITAKAASGYRQYNVTVQDTANNATVLAPFLILYKGASPSQQEIRDAIKGAVDSSGVGNDAEWQDRIPELYIEATIYLIPLYDNVTTLSDMHLYPSIVGIANAVKKTGVLLPTLGTTYLSANIEIVPANYEKLMMVAIGAPAGDGTAPKSLLEMHPTYQWTPSTDGTFQNMADVTQTFSLTLSTCLMVATGNGTSDIYTVETDQGLKYVSFVSQQYEYCVITSACYTELVAEAGV